MSYMTDIINKNDKAIMNTEKLKIKDEKLSKRNS